MELSELQKAALARWNELGSVTPANPVLQLAYEQYISPMGLRCAGMSYDALAALSDPDISISFSDPVFDLALIDKEWKQYPILAPLIPLLDRIEPIFNERGELTQFNYLAPTAAEDPVVLEFSHESGQKITELSLTTLYCAELYIKATIESLLENAPISQRRCELFLQNPRQYAEALFASLAKASV